MSAGKITITESLKPGSFDEESGHFKRLFTLSNWQYVVILGIAISGLAAFVNTYDAWSGINAKLAACTQDPVLKKELNTQFIVILVLSCLAVLLGIILAWIFRSKLNQRKIITLGITTAGVLGILYALSIKFQNTTNAAKLGVSWVSFLAFLILGYFISSNKKVAIAETTYD